MMKGGESLQKVMLDTRPLVVIYQEQKYRSFTSVRVAKYEC